MPQTGSVMILVTLVNLVCTFIIFLLCVIPPTPITSDDIWCTGGRSDSCNHFILFPIILSMIMIVYLIIALIFIRMNMCSPIRGHQLINCVGAPIVGCIVEFVASIAWMVAACVLAANTGFAKHWDPASGKVTNHVADSWFVPIFFTMHLFIAHMTNAFILLINGIVQCSGTSDNSPAGMDRSRDTGLPRYLVAPASLTPPTPAPVLAPFPGQAVPGGTPMAEAVPVSIPPAIPIEKPA